MENKTNINCEKTIYINIPKIIDNTRFFYRDFYILYKNKGVKYE